MAALAMLIAVVFSGLPLNAPSAQAQAPVPLDPLTLTKFLDPLTIPPVMQPTTPGGTHYEIGAWQIQQQVLPSNYPALTTVWAYGTSPATANYPAYTIEARRGVPITVRWTNHLVDALGNPLPHPLAVDQTLHWADPLMQMPNFNPYTGPVPLVTHLHGGEVETASDGGPDTWFTPNFAIKGPDWVKETYSYPNGQPATTLWYHDHALGITRLNVYMGLAGFYLLRDPAVEGPLNLPGPAPQIGDPPGIVYREIPIVIQDRSFNTDGSLAFPTVGNNPTIHPFWNPEFIGDTIVVNGKVWPYLNVEPKKYRFRFLDGSNARFYSLKLIQQGTLAPGPAFNQIGSDGGYLVAPVLLNDPANPASPRLTIAPGERADVIIDFTGIAPGTNFILDNNAPAPFPGGAPVDPNTTAQIMQFRVVAPVGTDTSTIPASLNTITPLAGQKLTRSLTLNEVLDPISGTPVMLVLDGKRWGAPITELPEYGTTEIWEIINLTMDTHPIHLHLVQFQLLSRQAFDTVGYLAAYNAANPVIPVPPGGTYTPIPVAPYLLGAPAGPNPNEAGWKDTVQMNPGEVTRIIVRFTPTGTAGGTTYTFDPTAGPPTYVWHCHIIDHEDNEMMRPYQVVMRTVVTGTNTTVNEGSLAAISGNFTDPDVADTHTAIINWGDGSTTAGTVVEPAAGNPGTVSGTHTYTTPGSYTVTITVVDNWGGIGIGTLVVTVQNVVPVVYAGPDATINEGATFNSSGNFTDLGAGPWTATVNYGDGSGTVPLTLNLNKTFALSHVYTTPGVYTVTVTVSDTFSGVGSDTATVTVLNVAPVVTCGPDQTIYRCETANVSATFVDPGIYDTHTATINWGDGNVTAGSVSESGGSGNVTGSHSYNTLGNYTATITVTDNWVASGYCSLQVTVKPVEVRIDITPGSSVNPINLKSYGLTAVAILGSKDFDVASVDTGTVTFGPNNAKPVRYEYQDVNSDGYTDLRLRFRTQDTGIRRSDTSATLQGQLKNGCNFSAADSIKIVPPF